MTTDCQPVAQVAPTTREALKSLQERMASCTDLLIDPPVTHRFVGGVYAREIFLPKGSITAGRIHKTEHISVISMGAVEVITDYLLTGEVEYSAHIAPTTFTSPVGTKRMVLALEDTIWTTFHPFNGKPDPDNMIDIMSWRDYSAFEQHVQAITAQECHAIEVTP